MDIMNTIPEPPTKHLPTMVRQKIGYTSPHQTQRGVLRSSSFERTSVGLTPAHCTIPTTNDAILRSLDHLLHNLLI